MGKFRILTSLLFLLLAISCQKDDSFIESNNGLSDLDVHDLGGAASDRGDKIDICHNGEIINVSLAAEPAHLGHGDALDRDGDGYFDIESVCGTEVDCDDYDPAVNPGAEEIIGNGIDDDCDPSTSDYLAVPIDPDPNETGDEYTIYVSLVDNSSNVAWSETFGTVEGANSLWDGWANTDAIVDEMGTGNYAAKICSELTEGGFEWYLPASGELSVMYDSLGLGGNYGFVDNSFYWSSTEENFIAATSLRSDDGLLVGSTKTEGSLRCRCVRR
jgi:putative metal-binding protein